MGQATRALDPTQRRGVLVHRSARGPNPIGARLGSHLPGEARESGTETYYSDVEAGAADPFRRCIVTGLAGKSGSEMAAGQRGSQLSQLDPPGTPAVSIASIPGPAGYFRAQGPIAQGAPFDATTGDTVGTMFLQVPDERPGPFDFTFTPRDGEEFLSFDSSVLRPAATVPHLPAGKNQVPIGAEGLGVAQDSVCRQITIAARATGNCLTATRR